MEGVVRYCASMCGVSLTSEYVCLSSEHENGIYRCDRVCTCPRPSEESSEMSCDAAGEPGRCEYGIVMRVASAATSEAVWVSLLTTRFDDDHLARATLSCGWRLSEDRTRSM